LNFCNTRLTSLSRLSMQLSTNPEGKAYHSNPHFNTEIEALTKLGSLALLQHKKYPLLWVAPEQQTAKTKGGIEIEDMFLSAVKASSLSSLTFSTSCNILKHNERRENKF
jgi:hypothetical protein